MSRAGQDAVSPRPTLVIEPRGVSGWQWAEFWRYRELLYFLTVRDVKVRYKQAALGFGWALLQPILTMVVFSLIFGRFAGLNARTGSTPYPVYLFVGLMPWTFFANAITQSSNSLVASSHVITRVYFPRLLIPLAAVLSSFVDFLVTLGVLVALMIHYDVRASWQVALAPLLLGATVLVAAGVGFVLAALLVSYRDVRYVVPFVVQLWLFLTPVIYPSEIVPEKWRWLLLLNPLSGLIEGLRGAFLGRPFDWGQIAIACSASGVIFVLGVLYFQSVERRFADVV